MKIIIDECLPKKLKHELPEHEVATVQEKGWSGKKNGELLRLMAGNIDVFITVDQNLEYQQNLKALQIAVIALIATTNRLEDLKPLMPEVKEKLKTIQVGELIRVKQQTQS